MNDKKKTVAQLLVEGLEEFAGSLKDGATIEESYNCHKFVLELEPAAYDPELVKKTRRLLGASQFIFAQFLGVSVNTVQAWEQGRKEPKDVACRFMDEIRRDPKHWQTRLRESIRPKTAGC